MSESKELLDDWKQDTFATHCLGFGGVEWEIVDG
jgi:hypothetical protein